MKVKKQPQRRCLVCQEPKDKRDLIRIVRSPEGLVSVDLTGRKAGRGAYICKQEACLLKAKKTGAIGRSLSVAVPDEVYEALSEVIRAHEE